MQAGAASSEAGTRRAARTDCAQHARTALAATLQRQCRFARTLPGLLAGTMRANQPFLPTASGEAVVQARQGHGPVAHKSTMQLPAALHAMYDTCNTHRPYSQSWARTRLTVMSANLQATMCSPLIGKGHAGVSHRWMKQQH